MSLESIKIGPKIKAFRRQMGLQANKFAEDLGISASYLNLIESGKRKIDGDLLLKVCDKLKIHYHQIKPTDNTSWIMVMTLLDDIQNQYLQCHYL